MFGRAKKPRSSGAQKKESLLTLERIINNIGEGLSMLAGLENQLISHQEVIEILEGEIQTLAKGEAEDIPYSPQELYMLEECLIDINDVVTRLHPAAYTDTGVLLKEIRTLISLGYERQNLLLSIFNLTNLLTKIEVFNQKYGKDLVAKNLTNSNHIKREMKKDEDLLIPILKAKFGELMEIKPDTTEVINKGLQYLEAGTKIMTVFDALDIEEIVNIDRKIRRLIVEDEADINKNHLHLDDASLGEGAFGIVDSATFKIPGKKTKFKVALKTLKLSDELLKDEYIELSNEVAKMKVLESPFIVYCYGLSLRKHHVHMVFERMDISLWEYLNDERKVLKERQFEKLARDVSLGMLQLHLMNITHRNLSSRNVMFSPRRFEDPIKIMDFGCGLSKYSAHTRGPTEYTPPEVFEAMNGNYSHSGWTTKGDIYSLGLVFWEACQKETSPFKDQVYNLHEYVGKYKNLPPMRLKATNDKWARRLIESCVDPSPGLRPNAKNVCETVFAYSSKASRVLMRKDLKDVKDTVQNTPSAFDVTPANLSARRSVGSAGEAIFTGPPKINVVGEEFRVSADLNVPRPAGRGKITSIRDMRKTTTSKSPPPGFEKVAPKHPIFRQDVVESDRSRATATGKDDVKSLSSSEAGQNDEFDNEDFYEEERDGEQRSDDASIASRGPDEEFVDKARRKGKLVQLAIDTSSNPKKLSRQVKKLKEDILEEESIDLGNFFSMVRMKKKLGDLDCQVIGLLVRWNHNLVRLNLEFNNITDDGIADLATGMKSHPSLLQLFLGGNPKITEINPLVRKLKKNDVLEVLHIDQCSIGNEGVRKIGQLLDSRSRLLELDLSGNKIGNQGMRYLAKGLVKNNELRALIVNEQTVSCKKGMKELRKVARKAGISLNKRLE